MSSFFHSTVSPARTVTVAGLNLNPRITTVTVFPGLTPEFVGRPALPCGRNSAAAISASAANKTSVANARIRLGCIGSSPLVTGPLPRGLLCAALDSGLHMLSVQQVPLEQWLCSLQG